MDQGLFGRPCFGRALLAFAYASINPQSAAFLGGPGPAFFAYTIVLLALALALPTAPIFGNISHTVCTRLRSNDQWTHIQVAALLFFFLSLPLSAPSIGLFAPIMGLFGGLMGGTAWAIRRPDKDRLPEDPA